MALQLTKESRSKVKQKDAKKQPIELLRTQETNMKVTMKNKTGEIIM